jgi:hypothetical protein
MYGGHGQLVLEEADGRILGGFESKAGRYRLDVDVLSGASSLNKGNPKLIVEVDGNGYERFIRWKGATEILAGILGTIGIALVWLSRPDRDASRRASIRLFPGSSTGYGSAFHARRPPQPVLFSRLPSIALYLTFFLMLMLFSILFMLGLSATLWHGNGIRVLTSSRTLSPQLGQGARPLLLRIDRKRKMVSKRQACFSRTISGRSQRGSEPSRRLGGVSRCRSRTGLWPGRKSDGRNSGTVRKNHSRNAEARAGSLHRRQSYCGWWQGGSAHAPIARRTRVKLRRRLAASKGCAAVGRETDKTADV